MIAEMFEGKMCYLLTRDDLLAGNVPNFLNNEQREGLVFGGWIPDWALMEDGDQVWVSQYDDKGWIMTYNAVDGAKPDDEGNGVYMTPEGSYDLG